MTNESNEFDLLTQRFLINRWRTEEGEKVQQEIIACLQRGGSVRNILDHYVIKSNNIFNPYEYPIYPKSEMKDGVFWVLTQDDLRGITFYNQDFSSSNGLSITSLDYCNFDNCNLSSSIIEKASISFSRFKDCIFENTDLAYSGGRSSYFTNCNFKNASFFSSWFISCRFYGSDLSNIYFEGAYIRNIKVDYLTKLDKQIRKEWKDRTIPTKQIPDILRAFRISYGNAELWDQMDNFLFEEKTAERNYILWPEYTTNKTFSNFSAFFTSLVVGIFSGYATRPFNLVLLNLIFVLVFSFIYWYFGAQSQNAQCCSSLIESIYFSLTSFTTLGFGDITFNINYPYLRILSSFEAFIGAITTSLFVVVFARKIFR